MLRTDKYTCIIKPLKWHWLLVFYVKQWLFIFSFRKMASHHRPLRYHDHSDYQIITDFKMSTQCNNICCVISSVRGRSALICLRSSVSASRVCIFPSCFSVSPTVTWSRPRSSMSLVLSFTHWLKVITNSFHCFVLTLVFFLFVVLLVLSYWLQVEGCFSYFVLACSFDN